MRIDNFISLRAQVKSSIRGGESPCYKDCEVTSLFSFTVAAALALLDAEAHALAVDVADLQRHHFARTQPGTVGDRQCRLVLQVAGCGDQAGHLVRAEHDW